MEQQQYGGLLGMIGQGDTLPNGLDPQDAWKAYMPGFHPSPVAVPQNNVAAQANQQPGMVMGYQVVDPNTGLMTGNGLGLGIAMLVKAAREGFGNTALNLSNLPKAPSGFSSAHWQAERERK